MKWKKLKTICVGGNDMTEIEKVINGLRCMKGDTILCRDCDYSDVDGYGNYSCKINCAIDAIELLKEQDKTGHWIYKKYDDMFMCSCCEKYSIRNDYPYCHWCGAKMEGQ